MSQNLIDQSTAKEIGRFELTTIRLPVLATFGSLVFGLAVGVGFSDQGIPNAVTETVALVGSLWLRALQMTIIPLVASLLVLGLVQMVDAARAGDAARKFIAL
ncbi:MAG: cation:dicarboxylase symporter family transporter, partial [Pseudomonadota bacterium]